MRAIFEADVARADDFSKLNNHGLAGAVTPAWKDRLGEVDVPTLVFHGDDDPLVREQEEKLQHHFGTAIHIRRNGSKGRIEIEFYSTDDLNRILELLE